MQGTDRQGPVAALKSAAAIAQLEATGTCVMNMMLDANLFKTKAMRANLKSLCQTYFTLGGTQLQITVVDGVTLEKALHEPQNYGSLMVRVGGYCDYFTHLNHEVQNEILKRHKYQEMMH